MDLEYSALLKNETLELVPPNALLLKGKLPI
jgi:hypothetical protein